MHPEELWNHATNRVVCRLCFEVEGRHPIHVFLASPVGAPRVANPERNWLTVCPGDELVENGRRLRITAVRLESVHPASHNDRRVTSGAAWLTGE